MFYQEAATFINFTQKSPQKEGTILLAIDSIKKGPIYHRKALRVSVCVRDSLFSVRNRLICAQSFTLFINVGVDLRQHSDH
jgi:hypothetical protein